MDSDRLQDGCARLSEVLQVVILIIIVDPVLVLLLQSVLLIQRGRVGGVTFLHQGYEGGDGYNFRDTKKAIYKYWM